MIRRYEPRDFADCDWLQKSFYKRSATQEELRGKLEHPSWVALDQSWSGGSEIVGNIITCPYWLNNRECTLIWSIVVAASYRGNGIGSSLMDAAESYYKRMSIWCHNDTILTLFVEPTNRAAQFYRKRGYEEVHFWPSYYGLNEPASQLTKNL